MGDGRSGLPLHSVEMGLDPGDAGASPPPIVLLHGLLGAGNNFRGWAKRITAALEATHAPARRIVAVDLRNHGESPHAADMSYATMAADVSLLLERLHLERCVLVGHSMGGKVAMATALLQPDQVPSWSVRPEPLMRNGPSACVTSSASSLPPFFSPLLFSRLVTLRSLSPRWSGL